MNHSHTIELQSKISTMLAPAVLLEPTPVYVKSTGLPPLSRCHLINNSYMHPCHVDGTNELRKNENSTVESKATVDVLIKEEPEDYVEDAYSSSQSAERSSLNVKSEPDVDRVITVDDDDGNTKKAKRLSRPPKYRCTICHRGFTCRVLLDNHMLIHRGDTECVNYECIHCGSNLPSHKALRQHLRDSVDCQRCLCTECGIYFKTKQDFYHHRRSHFVCDICGKGKPSKKQLESHLRRFHNGLPAFECPTCGKLFKSESSVSHHNRVFHSQPEVKKPSKEEIDHYINFEINKEAEHSCYVCGKQIRNKAHLKAHLYAHMESPAFECSTCGNAFKWQGSLNAHIRKFHDVGEYKCEKCDRLFTDDDSYQKHREWHGYNKDPTSMEGQAKNRVKAGRVNDQLSAPSRRKRQQYICTICDREFTSSTILGNHLLIHSGEKPFECDICRRRFRTKVTIAAHVLSHYSVKPYKCTICERMFVSNGLLNGHLASKHPGQISIGCKHCGNRFPSNKELHAHVKSSPECKLYLCTECGVYFKTRGDVLRHRRSHFVCDVCGKGQRSAVELNRHIRYTHNTDESDYPVCDVCGKKCRSEDYLKRHLTKHVDIPGYECAICGKTFKWQASVYPHVKKCHSGIYPKQNSL